MGGVCWGVGGVVWWRQASTGQATQAATGQAPQVLPASPPARKSQALLEARLPDEAAAELRCVREQLEAAERQLDQVEQASLGKTPVGYASLYVCPPARTRLQGC